jgi:drug/metabolite transporter (DMT)-like permease
MANRELTLRIRDWCTLLICNLIWASQFVLAKLVQSDMGPIFATILPMALATALLIPIVLFERRGHPEWHRPARADIGRFILIGIVGQVFAQLGITWGVGLAPASNAALLSLALPIATAVIAHWLLGERMTWLRWVSFALTLIGVLQCSGVDWASLRFTSAPVLTGNALILLGVLGSAFYNVYSKKLLHRFTPLEVLLYSYFTVLVCLLPLAVVLERTTFHRISTFTPRVWAGLGLLGLLQYFISMVLFLSVLTRLDAIQAGLSNYLIPIFGVIIAAAILHEQLTARMLVGGGVVIAGTVLITVVEDAILRRSARESVRNLGVP